MSMRPEVTNGALSNRLPLSGLPSYAEGDAHALWEEAQRLRDDGQPEAGARLELTIFSRYPEFSDFKGRLDRINKWRAEGFPALAIELANRLLRSGEDPLGLEMALALAELNLNHRQAAFRAFERARSAGATEQHAERFGVELQRVLGRVGPAVPRDRHATAESTADGGDSSRFLYVLGTSQVRTLAYSTGVFPIYIGGGHHMNFLNDEQWRLTEATVDRCIERIDRRQDVMLLLGGGDVNNYRTYQQEIHAEPGAADLTATAVIERSAARYVALVERLRRVVEGRIFLFGVPPTFVEEQARLASRFNVVVRDYCERSGVGFVDVVDYVSDPATGLLSVEMAIAEGNPHFHQQVTEEIIARLCSAGARIDGDMAPFAWSYLFQFPLAENIVPRIWSEPDTTGKNVVHLTLVSASQAVSRAAAILGVIFVPKAYRTVVVANCGEGLLPLYLPIGSAERIIGLPESATHRVVAERLRDFAGRSDVEFHDSSFDLGGAREGAGVVFCLEGMDQADCRIMLNRMLDHCAGEVFAVINGDVRVESWIRGKGRVEDTIPLGNRFSPPAWRSAALIRLGRWQGG